MAQGGIYRSVVRPLLFAISRDDPERAHELAIKSLAWTSRHSAALQLIQTLTGVRRIKGGREFFGLTFPSPVGLAAGFDKNGVAIPALAALGFGFIEAGTVTIRPQPGNLRPRMWRYPEQSALINAMGFPNGGSEAAATLQTQARRAPVPVGWNVSKSLSTDLDDAAADVCASLRLLNAHADYFVVNVSSPNTPGLRQLEDRHRLTALLKAAVTTTRTLAEGNRSNRPRPLLVKISPELTEPQLDDVVTACLDEGVAGIIATNTTLRRELIRRESLPDRGGVSGGPLRARSLEVVQHLVKTLDGRLPVIGVGGIASAEDARQMLDVGASLVQLYTGLVFRGPLLIRRINEALLPSWVRT